MELQLRLAERRGLLQGAYLSPVQAYAVEMLYLIDQRERGEGFADQVRLALLAGNPKSLPSLFPAWFADAGDETADDMTKIEWSAPQTENEHLALERWLAENEGGGRVSSADIDHVSGGGEWM